MYTVGKALLNKLIQGQLYLYPNNWKYRFEQETMSMLLRVWSMVAGAWTPEGSIRLTWVQGADQARCTDSAAAWVGQVVEYSARHKKVICEEGAGWFCTTFSTLLAGGGTFCWLGTHWETSRKCCKSSQGHQHLATIVLTLIGCAQGENHCTEGINTLWIVLYIWKVPGSKLG